MAEIGPRGYDHNAAAFFVTNTDDCRESGVHWISVAISMRWDPPPPLCFREFGDSRVGSTVSRLAHSPLAWAPCACIEWLIRSCCFLLETQTCVSRDFRSLVQSTRGSLTRAVGRNGGTPLGVGSNLSAVLCPHGSRSQPLQLEAQHVQLLGRDVCSRGAHLRSWGARCGCAACGRSGGPVPITGRSERRACHVERAACGAGLGPYDAKIVERGRVRHG